VPDPEDLDALTNSVSRLVPLGLKVSQREMREKIGLSEPATEDDILSAPAPAPAQPVSQRDQQEDKPPKRPAALSALAAEVADHRRACRCRACKTLLAAEAVEARADAHDDVEELIDRALDDWEEVAAPIVDPLLTIVEKAASFDEALAMLESAGPDTTRLAERLAVLTAIGRGLGDTKD
jgi:phage gp29-like protein